MIKTVIDKYLSATSTQAKLCDVFMAFFAYLALVQTLYLIAVGTWPFNSYVSGLFSAVGSLVLLAGLRIQLVNPEISTRIAFGEFLLCNAVLHIAVFNFLG